VLPPVLVVLPPLVVVPPELIVVPPLAVVAGELVVPPVRAPPVLVVPAEPVVPPVLAGVFPAVSQAVRRKNPIASLDSFIRLLRACSSVSYPLGSREFSTANHKP
jgi:hypothetical protein